MMQGQAHSRPDRSGVGFFADSNQRDAGKRPSAARMPLLGVDAEPVR
jgi:hypothetical protein